MKNNNFFIFNFLFIVFCAGFTVVNAQKKVTKNHDATAVNLKKIYVHDGNVSRKIILHFSKEPLVTYTPESIHEKERDENGLLKMTFFMPLVHVHDEVNKEALEAISGMHSPDYGISFYQVSKPMQGIKCLIAFNPDKIGFEYKTFKSVTEDKGIMFQFYHQDVLRKISETNNIRMQAAVNIKKSTLFSQVKKKIVLDYGHGGRDAGYTTGSFKEKDINLSIGKKIKKQLLKNGFHVCTTRNDDDFVPLDVRTSKVRDCQDAALLVSIHTNASSYKSVQGIETFYNHHTLFDNKLSMGDNSIKHLNADFDKIINKRSKDLAQLIHDDVLLNAAKINKKVVDRGIKNKAIQLLLGVEIPAVLIECGFLSHSVEGALLVDDSYQEKIAQGVTQAIKKFFDGQFV